MTLTFQHANNAQEDVVLQDVLEYDIVIEHHCVEQDVVSLKALYLSSMSMGNSQMVCVITQRRCSDGNASRSSASEKTGSSFLMYSWKQETASHRISASSQSSQSHCSVIPAMPTSFNNHSATFSRAFGPLVAASLSATSTSSRFPNSGSGSVNG